MIHVLISVAIGLLVVLAVFTIFAVIGAGMYYAAKVQDAMFTPRWLTLVGIGVLSGSILIMAFLIGYKVQVGGWLSLFMGAK